MNTLARDISGAVAAHALLLHDLADLTDEQARSPSLLPEWTLGHVLTHVARNADSHVGMFEAANRGEVAAQYPGGGEQRAADIELGASRAADELVADVAASIARLEAEWSTTTDGWSGEGLASVGLVRIDELPFRRWREAVVHHSDLGLSYSWRDWPADFVRLELVRATMLWASRKPMGLTTLPPETRALDDHEKVAWLLGRTTVNGLGAAGIF